MTPEHDRIPKIEFFKGVGIDDCQPRSRIENIVKPEINFVLNLSRIEDLYEFCGSEAHCPESRRLAAAKARALWDINTELREARPPGITLELINACVAGLDSVLWRDRHFYTSVLKTIRDDGVVAVRRDVPLPSEELGPKSRRPWPPAL